MISRTRLAGLLSALTAAAVIAVSAPAAAADVNAWDGNWHYDFAIYGWFPGVKGTFNFDLPPGVILPPPGLGESHSATVTPNDYLSSLQFVLMLAGEARKGNGAIFGDLIYMDMASLTSKVKHVTTPSGDVVLPVNADVNVGLRSTIFTLGGSYTIDRTRLGNFDLLGGFRYADMKTSLDWNFSAPNGILSQSGGTSETINLYDGIVGFRGAVSLSPDGKWYLPYYADIGAGNESNWTWQAYAGVGYRFDWGNVLVAFRNLSYNTSKSKSVESLDLTGPLIAFDFRW
jgi:hypothetical protein